MHTTALRCEIYPLMWLGGRAVCFCPTAANGSAPAWWVSPPPCADPSQVVRDALGERFASGACVVHSTSWRFEPTDLAVVLSYLAILRNDDRLEAPAGFEARPLDDLPRPESVLEHGLRHFALLRISDPAVAAALPAEWHEFLAWRHPLPAGLLHHYDELREALPAAISRP